MFGGKLEQLQNTLGELHLGGGKLEPARSSMLLDGQRLHHGGERHNTRVLGAMSVQVFRGAEATNFLELTREENARAARSDQRRRRPSIR